MEKNTYNCVLLHGVVLIVLVVLGISGQLYATMYTPKLSPAIAKKLEKPSPYVRKKIELIQKEKESNAKAEDKRMNLDDWHKEIYLYDENTKKGIVWEKDLVAMSPVLQTALSFDQYKTLGLRSAIPVAYSIDVIETVKNVLKNYKDCLEAKYIQKQCDIFLIRQIKQLPLERLISSFLLYDYLNIEFTINEINIEKAISSLFIESIQSMLKKKSKNKEEKISSSEFNLLSMIPYDLRKMIFSDKKRDELIQKIKQQLNSIFIFKAEPSFYMNYNFTIDHLFFNSDGSRLLFTSLGTGTFSYYRSSFIDFNMKNGRELATLIHFLPCWVDKDIIAYNEYAGSTTNQLTLYNCNNQKKDTYDICDNTWTLIDMIGLQEKKIAFVGISSDPEKNKVRIGIFDCDKKGIVFKELDAIVIHKLLAFSFGSLLFLAQKNEQVGIYALSFNGDFSRNEPNKISTISNDLIKSFGNGVVNSNGSKIAVIIENSAYIYPLNDTYEKHIQCKLEDETDILCLAFTFDNQRLLVGCSNGKIIVFDANNGEKIGTLLDKNKQVLYKNHSITFNKNGTKYAVGGYNEVEQACILYGDLKPLVKKEDVSWLDSLTNIYTSFGKIILMNILYKRAQEEMPVILTDAEENVLRSISDNLPERLAAIGWIAPQQSRVIQPIAPQQQKSFWQRIRDIGITMQQWLNYLRY